MRHTTRTRTATTLLAAAALTTTGAALTTTPAEARVNVHCAGGASSRLGPGDAWSAGIRAVDPIVSRGTPVSMHDHQFFGNMALLGLDRPDLANYSDLLGSKTTCNIAKDTASYWAPTLRYTSGPHAGETVPMVRYEMYYQSWNDKTTDPAKQTKPFPPDLRMVAGNPMAQTRADANVNAVNFSCGNFSSKAARLGMKYLTPRDADCSTATNLRPGENRFLTGIVHFPTCWTGKLNDHTTLGNTADYMGDPMFTGNQMAYTVNGRCPTGYPIKLPKARFTWQWDYRGDGTDIAFSSDVMLTDPNQSGVNWHADFWNVWDQPTLVKTVNYCINTSRPDALLHIGNTPRNPGLCGIPVP